MSFSCLIIEDNENQNHYNKKVLETHFVLITSIFQAFTLNETKSLLESVKPDIIIADVHLKDGIVFDVLKEILPSNSKLIFTTSHSQYAIEAFKFSAISYLLKPFTDSQFIDEVKKTISQINQDNYHKQLDVFFHNLKEKEQPKRIVLKNHDLIHVVDIQDIFYAQADNNYTHFFCANNQKILVSKSLKIFDERLQGLRFFRCHHSYLINLNKIKALHKSTDVVILEDDSTIPVASRKKKLLQEILKF